MEDLDCATQVLELLKLLSVWAYRHQDGADTVKQNLVRERWRMIRVLDLEHFSCISSTSSRCFLITLEELEEYVNNLGLDLNYVKVQRTLQTSVIHRDKGCWRLLVISRIV